ncbi:hypothetical protein CHS0354_040189 [Potamilus streckersoni]|nr:hypothetical protein CHS0354_040189 [Potamilus streckersoni]
MYQSDDDYATADNASTTFSVQSGYASSMRTDNYVPISRMSRNSKVSSSLPSILNLYRQPIREETTIENISEERSAEKRCGKNKRRERQSKEQKKTVDWDNVHERRASKETRSIRVESVALEQLEKYDAYVNAITSKVERQREARRLYNEASQARLQQQYEQEKTKLRLRRGPKHEYIHDMSYLKKLPESKFCKMVRLSDDLRKKGMLRGQQDLERFWEDFKKRSTIDEDGILSDVPNTLAEWLVNRKPAKLPEIRHDNADVDEAATIHKKKRKKRKKPGNLSEMVYPTEGVA